jgi:hypothetical protein
MIEKSDKLNKAIRATGRSVLGKKVVAKLNSLVEKPKISFLDFTVEEKTKVLFTGLQAKSETPYSDARRSVIKFASFLQKTLDLSEDDARSYQELLVASILKSENKDDVIKVVSGEEIRHYYLDANYVPAGTGNLRSCMSGKDAQPQLDLYCFNRNIQLVVNLLGGRVAARALLFNGIPTLESEELIKVLGRVYYSSQVSLTQIRQWSQNNTDYHLEGTDMYPNCTKPKTGTRYVFVPLEHYKFNATPYLDNLIALRIRKKEDKAFLTNDTTSRSYFPSPPSGGFPHPTNPNLVWCCQSGMEVWIDKNEAVLVKGLYYPKSECTECSICKNLKFGKTSNSNILKYYKGGSLCVNCDPVSVGTGMYARIPETTVCKLCRNRCLKSEDGCSASVLRNVRVNGTDGMCTNCIKNTIVCESSCKRRIPKGRITLIDGRNMCNDCILREKYSACSKCNQYVKNTVSYKKRDYCQPCRWSMSGEKEVEESDRMLKLSDNLVRVTI